jgi:hypothetical protein
MRRFLTRAQERSYAFPVRFPKMPSLPAQPMSHRPGRVPPQDASRGDRHSAASAGIHSRERNETRTGRFAPGSPPIRHGSCKGASRAKQHKPGVWASTVMSVSLRHIRHFTAAIVQLNATLGPHMPDANLQLQTSTQRALQSASIATARGEPMEISPTRFPFSRFAAILRPSPGSGR